MEGGCLAGGTRGSPSRASYPKGLGEFTPLACRAVQGAALASLAVNDCQACMGESRGGEPLPARETRSTLATWYILYARCTGSYAIAGEMATSNTLDQ